MNTQDRCDMEKLIKVVTVDNEIWFIDDWRVIAISKSLYDMGEFVIYIEGGIELTVSYEKNIKVLRDIFEIE